MSWGAPILLVMDLLLHGQVPSFVCGEVGGTTPAVEVAWYGGARTPHIHVRVGPHATLEARRCSTSFGGGFYTGERARPRADANSPDEWLMTRPRVARIPKRGPWTWPPIDSRCVPSTYWP